MSRITLIVTSASKLTLVLHALRSPQLTLVGEINEHEWMLHHLKFIVATPVGACRTISRGKLSSPYLKAVVVDDDAAQEDPDSTHKLLGNLHLILPEDVPVDVPPSLYSRPWLGLESRLLEPPKPPMKGWLDPEGRYSLEGELRSLLQQFLPEALSCPGLGDTMFAMGVDSFGGGRDVVHQDQSSILIFMPGILKKIHSPSSCHALVLAPESRVSQMAHFIHAFVNYMGLNGLHISCINEMDTGSVEGLNVAVGTPDKLYRELSNGNFPYVQQLLLIEADKMLVYKEKILSIFDCLEENVQVGLHSHTWSAELEDFVARNVVKIPRAEATLEDVTHFYLETNNDGKKLNELCRLYTRLRRNQAAVVCDTLDRVVDVEEQMKALGQSVHSIHSDMQSDNVEAIKRQVNICMIITDVECSQGAYNLINFDMPKTPEEYLYRGAKQRDQYGKVVINFVTNNCEMELLENVKKTYGIDVNPLQTCNFDKSFFV